jgi:hypothetical protein
MYFGFKETSEGFKLMELLKQRAFIGQKDKDPQLRGLTNKASRHQGINLGRHSSKKIR